MRTRRFRYGVPFERFARGAAENMPALGERRELLQSVFDQPLLLFSVSFVRTCGRAGVLHAACIVDHAIETFEITGHELPRPHVPRFLLTPDQVNAGTVASQNVDDTLFRERIEFFDADDRDVFALFRSAGGDEIVVDLTGTKDDFADAGGIQRIADDFAERATGQFAEARYGSRRSATGSWE